MNLSTEATVLLESMAEKWLRETEMGRSLLADQTIEEAKAGMMELLAAGFLKFARNHDGTFKIRVCNPPEPPPAFLPNSISRVS